MENRLIGGVAIVYGSGIREMISWSGKLQPCMYADALLRKPVSLSPPEEDCYEEMQVAQMISEGKRHSHQYTYCLSKAQLQELANMINSIKMSQVTASNEVFPTGR